MELQMVRVFISAALILAVCTVSLGAAATRHGEQIVRESCTSCHSLVPVCGKVGSAGPYWKKTVGRMIRNGARIHPGEVEEAAAYLAALSSENRGVCR
jgi:cytochrome c2